MNYHRIKASTGKFIARKPERLALAVWALPVAIILVMVAINPVKRSVTSTFHRAVQHWVERSDLYSGFDYHYPPHFAVLFAPFHLLPVPVGDILWRLLCAALLVTGLRRLCRALDGEAAEKLFLWATLLALPLSLAALRNGQANALLAGLFAHAIVSLIQRRWWPSVICLLLALGVKQFAIVFPLLAAFVYTPLNWRFLAGSALLGAFPFLFANPHYVLTEYPQSIEHLQACAQVTQNRFADIAGIVRAFHAEMSPHVSEAVRLAAAGLTLALWIGWGRRLREPLRGLWLYALGTAYLMLFNPMTETNSYVIIAPAMACWAVYALHCRMTRKFGLALAGVILSLGLLPSLFRPLLGNQFPLVLYPLGAACFAAVVWYLVSQKRAEHSALSDGSCPVQSPSSEPAIQ
jgi:alpha-1,2-mannosyltransferase